MSTTHPIVDKIKADIAAKPTAPDVVLDPETREALGAIELDVTTGFTLADAMREGSNYTGQQVGGWIVGENACALGAGFLSASARGYVP